LPDTGAASALAIAEKIHHAVRQLRIQHESGANGYVSVSVGVASGTAEVFPNAAALVKAADEAMYQAKSTGRDKVVVFPNTPSKRKLSVA